MSKPIWPGAVLLTLGLGGMWWVSKKTKKSSGPPSGLLASKDCKTYWETSFNKSFAFASQFARPSYASRDELRGVILSVLWAAAPLCHGVIPQTIISESGKEWDFEALVSTKWANQGGMEASDETAPLGFMEKL